MKSSKQYLVIVYLSVVPNDFLTNEKKNFDVHVHKKVLIKYIPMLILPTNVDQKSLKTEFRLPFVARLKHCF